MTKITLAVLGDGAGLTPFVVLLANELGLAGLPAGTGPVSAPDIWLGLWPQTDGGWTLQTWAPDSLGASVRLAADVHQGLRSWLRSAPQAASRLNVHDQGVTTVWPGIAGPAGAATAETVVSLPPPAALIRDGRVTAVATRLAQAVAAALARHAGVAGQQLFKAAVPLSTADKLPPREVQPETELPEPQPAKTAPPVPEPDAADSPPARSADAMPAADTPEPSPVPAIAAAEKDGPARPRSRRSERIREGLQGSRTYEHPPWQTSERLTAPPQPLPVSAAPPASPPPAAP